MAIFAKLKNKISNTAEMVTLSRAFDFSNRVKFLFSFFFPRQLKLFLDFSTPEGIRVKDKNELAVYVDDFIHGDILEPAYIDHLKSKNNPVIVDLGCNTGLVAEYWMRLNPNTHYYAFDMMKECILAAQDRLSKYKVVSCFDYALGDKNESTDINYESATDCANSLNRASGKKRRTVQMRRLDDVQEIADIKEIDLLKVDVEGFEEPVLDGAIKTLAKSQYVVIELHLPKHREDYSGIVSIFLKSGHVLYKVKSRNLFFKKHADLPMVSKG